MVLGSRYRVKDAALLHLLPWVLVVAMIFGPSGCVGAEFFLDWEDGFPDGSPGLSPALEPSFSMNMQSTVERCSESGGNEITECKCGVDGYSPRNCDSYWGISSLHGHEVLTGLDWARRGQGVLKYWADGSARGLNDYVPSGQYASNRAEIGSIGYMYFEGDDVYYTASFYFPSDSWNQVSKYSTIITQWKMTSNPHGALRISNYGDYKLYYEGIGDWPQTSGSAGDGYYLGQVKPNAWNDVKIYNRKSTGSSGLARIYLNGEKVFDYFGKTLSGTNSNGGYVKFGMYTEVRDYRVLYVDAVGMTTDLSALGFASEEAWVAEHRDKPTVAMSGPSDGSQMGTGVGITLSADANDPDGIGGAGSVAKVEFLVRGDCLVSADAAYPYSVTFDPPSDGLYEFHARVTDRDGNTATSGSVTVRSGPTPPTAAISSHSNGDDVSSSAVTVSATVTPGDAAITDVEFHAIQNGNNQAMIIGSTSSATSGSTYSVQWTPGGNYGYTIYAVATDGNSKSGESDRVRIAVGGSSLTTTLTPTDDTTLLSGQRSTTTNWGKNEIYTKPEDVWITSIVKVDASSLESAGDIRSAVLRINLYELESGGPWNFAVWSTIGSESWDESSTNWNNAPARKDKLAVISISSTGWNEFDVTEYLNTRLQDGDSLGAVTFWLQGDDSNYERLEFYSIRDASRKPQFVVQYSTVAVPSEPAAAPPLACPVSAPTSTPATPTPPSEPAPEPALSDPAASATTAFGALHDASLQQAKPDLTGNWGNVEAYAKQPNLAIVGVFKFDVTSLSGKTVQEVKLQLYVNLLSPSGGATFSVWSTQGADDWEESTVTWNNGPREDQMITSKLIDGTNQYFAFDLTEYFKTRVDAGSDLARVSLLLKGNDQANEVMECHSNREGNAFPPRLVIKTGAEVAAPPSDPAPPAGPAPEPTPPTSDPGPPTEPTPPAGSTPPANSAATPAGEATTNTTNGACDADGRCVCTCISKECEAPAGAIAGAVLGTFFGAALSAAIIVYVYRHGKDVGKRRLTKYLSGPGGGGGPFGSPSYRSGLALDRVPDEYLENVSVRGPMQIYEVETPQKSGKQENGQRRKDDFGGNLPPL